LVPSTLPSSTTSVSTSTPQAVRGTCSSTPPIDPASSYAAITTTTGANRRCGWRSAKAATASARTSATYGFSAFALRCRARRRLVVTMVVIIVEGGGPVPPPGERQAPGVLAGVDL